MRRTNQIYKRPRRNLKPALLVLALILGVIFLGKSFQFIASLQKPFTKDLLSKKEYTWDGKTSLNLVIKTNSVSVLHYDPHDQKAVILKIPNETYMELPKKFGTWPVGSIYDLGQEENPPIGSELLKQSISKLIGLPIDGFITLQKPTEKPFEETIGSWRKNFFTALVFVNQIKTDLTPIETLRFVKALSNVRSDKLISLDLSQSQITYSKLLPDSSRVLGVDSVQLDLFIRKHLSDTELTQEDTTVAIFNATEYPGLAQKAGRIATNLGANVIITTNTENLSSQTTVVSSVKNPTFKRLSQAFAPWCLSSQCSINDPKVLDSRAQINIVLGEDFYNEVNRRYNEVN